MGMLEGKTAFVTGGTGGIGSAICARFEKEGAEVIAADLSDNDGAASWPHPNPNRRTAFTSRSLSKHKASLETSPFSASHFPSGNYLTVH